MNLDKEQLTEELVQRAKGRSAVFLSADPETKQLFDLIKQLNQIPKVAVPMANFERVKNQILDRIAIPKEQVATSTMGIFLTVVPRFMKITGSIIGAFVVLIGATIGVSAAAIQSVPGQPIYPVKKVVETVQLKLASTDAEKASLQIKFANNRLEELEKILEQGQQGKISDAAVQKIVENTVNNISKTANSVSEKTTAEQPQTDILNKLVDLNNKQTALLKSASTKSEGDVKVEIDKALETANDSRQQTIDNIEKAGLKIEDQPISVTDQNKDAASAHGKVTQISETSISIGTSKFLLTKDTKFVSIKQVDLKLGMTIGIKGQVIQSNTYALEVIAEDLTTLPDPPTKPSTDKTVPDASGK